MAIPDLVIVVGLLVGLVAVGTVCYVFAIHKTFGLGGSVLCVSGLLLIGLSVWKNAEVEVSETGVTVKVQALEESVENLKQASEAINTEVERVAKGAETIRASSEEALTKLQTTVRRQHPGTAESLPAANLGGRIYDPAKFRSINQSLMISGEALRRAKQVPLKPPPPSQ